MNIEGKRSSGILLHFTSLPSEYGIGDLGPEAYHTADKIHKAGATLWQVLPLGPTGYGNSPYAQRSAFAANEMLISPEMLYRDGYLTKEDLLHPEFPEEKIDFRAVEEWKVPRLRKAAEKALKKEKEAIAAFRKKEAFWIEDYALFMVIYDKYKDARWHSAWMKKEGLRDRKTLAQIKKEKKDEIDIYIALQYLFQKELTALKNYMNKEGILLIGDIPIFAAADSTDTWSHLELFKTDADGHYSAVSGVPPDSFSPTGQLWGNPVYDWQKHEEDGFSWWKERIKRTMEFIDILRIDHFRGFDAYFEIDASAQTAEHGIWMKSPGDELFKAMKNEFGALNIIAEDLGVITPEVDKLRLDNGFPGMKILQFAFAFDNGDWQTDNAYLPHNIEKLSVAYTGTHDNNTTKGWYDELDDGMKDYVRRYFECSDDEVVWRMIRALMGSPAMYAIFPMQDILGLGSEARMNVPSTCGTSNWSWRMRKNAFSDYRIGRFAFLSRISGRNGMTYEEHERL